MMKTRMLALLILVSTLVLTACIGGVSTPTQFYSLHSEYMLINKLEDKTAQQVSIGMGPISLPGNLDRPQIITRQGSNQILVAEFHHWAGDLKNNAVNVLTSQMMQGLQSNRVFKYPWPRNEKLDYRIRIDVLDFTGSLGAELMFNGTWTLLYNDKDTPSEVYSFSMSKKLADNTYSTLVESMTELLVSLSKQMVNVIKQK